MATVGSALKLFDQINNTIKKVISSKEIKLTDEYITIQAKLKFVNDGNQAPQALQNAIFAAANRSGSDYGTMAGIVAKLGQTAGGAFSGNKETISFTELIQKSLKIGGSSKQDQQAGMSQITKIMASGKMQGQDFGALMESAPVLAESIANFVGKSKEQLKTMGTEGTITSTVLKGAIFKAADDINSRFDKLPKTFEDAMTIFKNNALQAFGPVMEKVNNLLNSSAGGELFSGISIALNFAAVAAGGFVNVMSGLIGLIQAYWPFVVGMLTAAAVVIAGLIIPKLWAMIPPLWGQVTAAYALAGAWFALNLPLLAVAALIGTIVFVLLMSGVTAEQVVGTIAGCFMMLVGSVSNSFAILYNIIVGYVEFFRNLFIDPIYAVQNMYYNLAMNFGNYMLNMIISTENFAGSFMKSIVRGINGAIEGFNWLASAVSGIFGKDFKGFELLDESNMHAVSDTVKNVMDMMEKPVSDKAVVSMQRMGFKDLKNEFDYGYKSGAGIMNKISSIGNGLKDSGLKDKGFNDSLPLSNNTLGKVNEVGAINDTVDISNEDLMLMRDVAERDSIKNFVSLTPTVAVGDVHIHDTTDADEMIRRITEAVEVEVTNHAQGVYAG
ncbi:tail length tape measure protein [Paenibacillus marchantiophytorum]|uniref:Tail length tape measure protein n=1 Tax=Paenibacillus marchantiophytorum TaxID=1619310 RepID=A0ABQ2BP84_9BACL|nr:tape measure protein [Paenibacillus marchantiophytorum]GGI44363.1 tail length tape measure protein [Paenibacillus marchantiophytorum]